MDLHEEIAKVARGLYEKSGRIEGRDRENWLDAEKIVLSRHAGQDMEEPEGEEAITEEETIAKEVEETEPEHANLEEEEETTVIEEIAVREPFIAKKRIGRIAEVVEKIMPAKKGGSAMKTAAPKKISRKKT